jgi:hypothetical protein
MPSQISTFLENYVMPTFCDVINNKSAVPLLKNFCKDELLNAVLFMFLSCGRLHNDNVINLIKVEKTLLSNVLMRFPSKMSDSKFSKHLIERIEMSRIALLNSTNINI